QRERRERTLSAAQQVDPLRPLASRRGRDLDRGLERIVRIRQPDVALAALEQRLEGPAEVGADLLERLGEELPRGPIDLADRRLEVIARPDQVVTLTREELEPPALLLVLLHRQHVDRAEPVQVGGDGLELRTECVGLALDGLGLVLELGERAAPFGLEALADAAVGSLLLGAEQVEAVPLLGELLGRPAQLPGLRFQLLGRRRGVLCLLVERAKLAHQLVPRLEQALELGAGGGPEVLELHDRLALLDLLAVQRRQPHARVLQGFVRRGEAAFERLQCALGLRVHDAELGLFIARGIERGLALGREPARLARRVVLRRERLLHPAPLPPRRLRRGARLGRRLPEHLLLAQEALAQAFSPAALRAPRFLVRVRAPQLQLHGLDPGIHLAERLLRRGDAFTGGGPLRRTRLPLP